MEAWIAASKNIDSNFERRRALSVLAGKAQSFETLVLADFVDAADLDSDHERFTLWRGVLDENLSDLGSVVKVLPDVVMQFDSDYELGRLFHKMVDRNEFQVKPLLETVTEIDSDYERSRVLQSIVEKRELAEDEVALVLRRLEEMDSKYERGKVLRQLNKFVELRGQNEEDYQRMVDQFPEGAAQGLK